MMTNMTLPSAFGINDRPELVAIVGGGGKTSLMFALAAALPGRVVMTTTTRIFAAQMKLAAAVCDLTSVANLGEKLNQAGACLVVGEVQGEKALGVPSMLPGQLLARPDVDYVLVEADGSRMRPIKAPADHEPVVPEGTTLLVPTAGIDALAAPLAEVAHRPDLVARLLGKGDRLSAEDVALLLTHEQGGLKGVPDGARVVPLINKVETEAQLTAARQIARHILATPRVEQVVIGAVKTRQPVREVQSRVTAVILAAGEAKRMGQTKQLLPWGETTVLGQTIRNLKQTAVHDILVVSGHEAEAIEAVARDEYVKAIHNPQYAAGEMVSSLHTAVRHLPDAQTAVLVMLADQPMVPPETIDALLAAYWRGQGSLIAPEYEGRRGNPVLIARRHFSELLSLLPGDAPRTLLKRHPAELYLMPVGTDAILRDLDKLDDYERERP